jgi:hypothetical protein
MKRKYIVIPILAYLSLIFIVLNLIFSADSKSTTEFAKIAPWIWFSLYSGTIIYCLCVIARDIKHNIKHTIDDVKHALDVKLAMIPFFILNFVVCLMPIFEFKTNLFDVGTFLIMFELTAIVGTYIIMFSTSVGLIKPCINYIRCKSKEENKNNTEILILVLATFCLFCFVLDALGTKILYEKIKREESQVE